MTNITESVLKKIENMETNLDHSALQELRQVFQTDKKHWIRFINSTIIRVKKKEDFNFFFYFLDQFPQEILEVAPFAGTQLNRVFLLLIKFNYYKQLAAQTTLLEHSANLKLLEEINQLIQEKAFEKFLSTMEIYKLKRLVYQLTQKYEKKDIAYQLRIDLENPDLEWKDSIEN